MPPIPVIAVFDVGKTNKKLLLFDEDYTVVFERSARFSEITDEDGFPCENLESLKRSVVEALAEVKSLARFDLKAINFSAYGASFVYLDDMGEPVAPLYNYLKPYPDKLQNKFYRSCGGKQDLCRQTASPALGSLNSGLQLYRIKNEQPELFRMISHALHLPQYLSYLLTGQPCSDMTSIGCHTALWDFNAGDYHSWVYREGLDRILAPIQPADTIYEAGGHIAGIGLHDSSAALIPYLMNFREPFVLISTGTWSISLNPFNQSSLTIQELKQDCLDYLQYTGKPVKASRFFIGHYYEEKLKELEARFGEDLSNYRNLEYNETKGQKVLNDPAGSKQDDKALDAYYCLMADIVKRQKRSTDLILTPAVDQIFVDGGFSRNKIFMSMLAALYPGKKIFAATVPQSTALGAALAIHSHWNSKSLPAKLIDLRLYSTETIS